MKRPGSRLKQGVRHRRPSKPGLRSAPQLTWAKASNRGRLSHLRKAKDLVQRATSLDVRLGVWGNRSAAKRWNTCVWWKPSLPWGQSPRFNW